MLNGPPDAVINTFSTLLFLVSWIKDHIEKCSESTGMNLTLNLSNSFLINDQPQIMDSLLAIATFFANLIIFKVGLKPSKPEIAFNI